MKYYQAETHCHTMEVSPCSRIKAAHLVQGYLAAGYRYLFITDHYHPAVLEEWRIADQPWEKRIDFFLSGYEAAWEAAKGTPLKVLLGMEMCLGIDPETKLGNDILVYGFDREFLLEYPYLYRMEYQEFYKLIRKNNYLAFQAHPYRYGMQPVEPICYDGIEIVNTHPRHKSHNLLAFRFALEHGLYVIGGSDAHADEDIGRGGVMLPQGIETPKDLVAFYRENGSPELIVTFGA